MGRKGNTIIIAKDGWPLEQFIGKPITNFFRRLILGHHRECRACYERRQSEIESAFAAAQRSECYTTLSSGRF